MYFELCRDGRAGLSIFGLEAIFHFGCEVQANALYLLQPHRPWYFNLM